MSLCITAVTKATDATVALDRMATIDRSLVRLLSADERVIVCRKLSRLAEDHGDARLLLRVALLLISDDWDPDPFELALHLTELANEMLQCRDFNELYDVEMMVKVAAAAQRSDRSPILVAAALRLAHRITDPIELCETLFSMRTAALSLGGQDVAAQISDSIPVTCRKIVCNSYESYERVGYLTKHLIEAGLVENAETLLNLILGWREHTGMANWIPIRVVGEAYACAGAFGKALSLCSAVGMDLQNVVRHLPGPAMADAELISRLEDSIAAVGDTDARLYLVERLATAGRYSDAITAAQTRNDCTTYALLAKGAFRNGHEEVGLEYAIKAIALAGEYHRDESLALILVSCARAADPLVREKLSAQIEGAVGTGHGHDAFWKRAAEVYLRWVAPAKAAFCLNQLSPPRRPELAKWMLQVAAERSIDCLTDPAWSVGYPDDVTTLLKWAGGGSEVDHIGTLPLSWSLEFVDNLELPPGQKQYLLLIETMRLSLLDEGQSEHRFRQMTMTRGLEPDIGRQAAIALLSILVKRGKIEAVNQFIGVLPVP